MCQHHEPIPHDPTVESEQSKSLKRFLTAQLRINSLQTWKSVSRVANRTPSSTMRRRSMHANVKMRDFAVSTANISPFKVAKSYECRCFWMISLVFCEIVGPVMEEEASTSTLNLSLNQSTNGSHSFLCSLSHSSFPYDKPVIESKAFQNMTHSNYLFSA